MRVKWNMIFRKFAFETAPVLFPFCHTLHVHRVVIKAEKKTPDNRKERTDGLLDHNTIAEAIMTKKGTSPIVILTRYSLFRGTGIII